MPISNQKETIDIRILRLIGLEDVFDLDYETYSTLLKEAMIKGRMAKTAIPTEEVMLLTEEYKRIKTKKGRFEVKKKSKIGASSFSVGNIKAKFSAISPVKALPGTSIGKSPAATSVENNISAITSSFISILDTLKNQKKQDEKEDEYGRRKSEQEKRSLTESKLEKRFEGLKKVAEKVIAPVKSLLDRILEFFTTVILGRIVYKLIEWMGDPKNASKVKSIIRFVKDWWPALIGGFVLFGTRFGKGVRVLTKIALSAVGKLSKAIPVLLRFAKKNPAAALGIATGAYAATQLSQRAFSGGNEEQGGVVKFAGGGLNFGFTNIFNGLVSGEKGVDKVPAMLSDGEFVMSRGAVQKYGVDTLESMNAAGGGTNKPKIVSGTTYAAGGGYIGSYKNKSNNADYRTSPEYYVREILKGLSPQYEWANSLAKQAGISAQNAINQYASSSYNTFMNEGSKMHGYLTRGGIQNDAINFGNRALNSLQNNFNTVKEVAKNSPNTIGKFASDAGKKYNNMSKQNEKKSQEAISKYDAWVQSLPKGFLKDTMNRGLIPIPTGNELGMTGLTYIKAMLGPLGRPFKILSNESVDKARQEMIDRTAAANGMRVGPDGKMSMEWNRVSGKGSGQYTDELDALGGNKSKGKFFNSTFGRWSGRQKGDKIVTDDVYNFNESVGNYAKKSKDALMKGNIGEALYNVASMTGRFAQDIGWMNQRALGSEIEVGSVKNIDSKTGKLKSPPPSVTMYSANDPRRKNTGQPYKSRFARPKNAGMRPVNPPTTKSPKVVYSTGGGGMGGARGSRPSKPQTPNFSATAKGSNAKAKTLGITR